MKLNIIGSYMPANDRQSNIELLRIVAMSMIVIGHFLYHGVTKENMPRFLYELLYTYCRDGVNLFFLISGFFRIKSTVKSVARLVFTVLFFECINYLLVYVAVGEVYFDGRLSTLFFPVSAGPYWFLQVYLALIICSPLINRGIDGLSLNKLRGFMLILSLFTFYSCGFGGNMSNPNGYSFLQGVYMYCVAAYLKKDNRLMSRLKGTKCIVVAFVMLTFGALMVYYYNKQSLTSYNGFINIISSTLIFTYFVNLDIKSKTVNIIASGALGCYLLQDGLFGHRYLYATINRVFTSEPLYCSLAYLTVQFISFWALSLLITMIVRPLFRFLDRNLVAPISKKLGDFVDKIPVG